MMKKTMLGMFAAGALALAGCGGVDSAQRQAIDAVPTASAMALDMEGAAGAAGVDGTALTTPTGADAATADPSCHPHLFRRTQEVVGVINHHIQKVWRRVDAAVKNHKNLEVGQSFVWTHVENNEEVKLTLTKTAERQYGFEAQVKPEGTNDSDYVTVVQGTLTGDATTHDRSGNLHLDLTALSKAFPWEKSQGEIDSQFTWVNNTQTKTAEITLTGFQPDDLITVRPPRDGHYVFAHTKNVGGSLKFQEDVALLCPANPNRLSAVVETVGRWAHQGTDYVGRADAKGSGGQIATDNTWLALSCYDADDPYRNSDPDGAERYWQVKLEDGSGKVVAAWSKSAANDPTNPQAACSPVFGPIPALDSNANDYDFSKINFEDSSVVPYPGQPSP